MGESVLLLGLHTGEHGYDAERLIEDYDGRKTKEINYMSIAPGRGVLSEEQYYSWAKWCRDHKVYFSYSRSIQLAPPGMECRFTREMVDKMKEIAGEYYLGDTLAELGSEYGARLLGYDPKMPAGMQDMQQCRDYFIKSVKHYVDIDTRLGMNNIIACEATAMVKYTYDAGITLAITELMPGDPEFMLAINRGCAYCYERKLWGLLIAHEWYGGVRNSDPLKQKRFKVDYGYSYLAGSHVINLESGDWKINSYGTTASGDHPLCKDYRDTVLSNVKYMRENPRIADEPLTKVAFLYGNLDGYTGFMGSSVWEQYDRPEWSRGEAEWSWRITEELHHSRSWQDVENYGDEDLSGAPAYGLYDVVPAEAPVDKLKKYDTLIFLGWNSMTPEIWNNLKEYVAGGGHLMMTAAHLNTNITRDGKYLPINDGKTSDFLGFDIVGQNTVNLGVKFVCDSLREGVMFPMVPRVNISDPIHADGIMNAIQVNITTAQATAIWSDRFLPPIGDEQPAVLENKYGEGVVTVMASRNYPGNGSVYPLYRAMVWELMTASHRKCDVKVVANDKVKFSVYRDDKEDMIMLLNTDLSNPVNIKITAHGKTVQRTLQPCELSYEKIAR